MFFRRKVTKISHSALSEKGRREINQDAVFAAELESYAVFVVADGMGGHSYGEIASREIVKGIAEWWGYVHLKADTMTVEEAIAQCKEEITRINTELYMKYATEGIVVGTTVALLLIWRESYVTLSVGDSHIYRLEDKNAVALTLDDIWDNLPDIKDSMTDIEKERHPSHEKLTAAIGPNIEVSIREGRGIIEGRERFLICSDGIYKYVDIKDISHYLSNRLTGIESVMKKIKKKAISNKTKDNYSMVICDVRQ